MKIENLQIIHSPTSDSPFLVVSKPAGIPSAPLFEGDDSVLTWVTQLFPQISGVHGKKKVEHGLIHRIDTETNGLILIATSQIAYDNLIQSQQNGFFEKWYRAGIEQNPFCTEILKGFPPVPAIKNNNSFELQSYFRAFGIGRKEVRPVTDFSGRKALKNSGSIIYKTEISFENENTALCHIKSGFRHQVRCHLAWCGFPIVGDKIYNPKFRTDLNQTYDGSVAMQFSACKISFPHPLSGEIQVFET